MEKKNMTKKRRQYDAEFKANILQLHKDGRTVRSLSESFGINENIIYRWKKQSKALGSGTDSAVEEELKQVRKQLKEVEQERDILKKALSIFSRPT